jgi:hypothetical protein
MALRIKDRVRSSSSIVVISQFSLHPAQRAMETGLSGAKANAQCRGYVGYLQVRPKAQAKQRSILRRELCKRRE